MSAKWTPLQRDAAIADLCERAAVSVREGGNHIISDEILVLRSVFASRMSRLDFTSARS